MNENKYTFADHAITLEGVQNARELGGYKIGNQTIRHDILLRSGNLSKATPNDIKWLKEKANLSLIIDLRSERETIIEPDAKIDDTKYISLPTIDEASGKANDLNIPNEAYGDWGKFLIEFVQSDKAERLERALYPAFIQSPYSQEQFGKFMRAIVDTNDGAVLWHCAQGKDRTGLGAAFILGALGADNELIINDFAISNEYYADEIEHFAQKIKEIYNDDRKCQIIRSFVGVNVDYFGEALKMINKSYGSMNDYLIKQLKLTEKDLNTLKERYLE